MRKIGFLLLLLLLLAGCGEQASPDKELWVVTERSTGDGMNYQARNAVKDFEQRHEGMTVRLEYLPQDKEERELYLQQLRTQIMAGAGPDVYLLPTGGELLVESSEHTAVMEWVTVSAEPLFHDVEQSMRLGVFADLSAYYDADEDLHTECLQQQIMEAGKVGDCRYVLPLRYSMPVLLADHANPVVQAMNVDVPLAELAGYGIPFPTDYSVFPKLFDYDRGEVLVSQEQIAAYLRACQQNHESAEQTRQQLESEGFGYDKFNSVLYYIYDDINWTNHGIPFFATDLSGAYDSAWLKEGKQLQTEAYPMRAADGSVGAEVTYFGAVGIGCKDTELAYDYLRLFLTEDYQWDKVRQFWNEGMRNRPDPAGIGFFNRSGQTRGRVENSWPVRAMGAASALVRSQTHQISGKMSRSCKPRRREMGAGIEAINDEDMPILTVPIDHVSFRFYQPSEESLAYALERLTEDGADIDQLAGQLWQALQFHLTEG